MAVSFFNNYKYILKLEEVAESTFVFVMREFWMRHISKASKFV